MPWQDDTIDVAREIDPATGELAHPVVVITVQRQAGKTVLSGSNATHVCLTEPDMTCWYTAGHWQGARQPFQIEDGSPSWYSTDSAAALDAIARPRARGRASGSAFMGTSRPPVGATIERIRCRKRWDCTPAT